MTTLAKQIGESEQSLRQRGVGPQCLARNRLLRNMDSQDLQHLVPHLNLVAWQRGEIIHEIAAVQRYAYFPLDALASIVLLLEDGHSCEIVVVGNDGLLGVSIFTQIEAMPAYSIAQVAGSACRVSACVLRDLFLKSESFRALMLRYTQVLLMQIGQSVTCNRYHTIHQQLARWLLVAMDHLPYSQLELTQEQIAHILGVRREGVTEAAGRLQKAGLIECGRGRIRVLDRKGLERVCCECYHVVKRETEHLLPD